MQKPPNSKWAIANLLDLFEANNDSIHLILRQVPAQFIQPEDITKIIANIRTLDSNEVKSELLFLLATDRHYDMLESRYVIFDQKGSSTLHSEVQQKLLEESLFFADQIDDDLTRFRANCILGMQFPAFRQEALSYTVSSFHDMQNGVHFFLSILAPTFSLEDWIKITSILEKPISSLAEKRVIAEFMEECTEYVHEACIESWKNILQVNFFDEEYKYMVAGFLPRLDIKSQTEWTAKLYEMSRVIRDEKIIHYGTDKLSRLISGDVYRDLPTFVSKERVSWTTQWLESVKVNGFENYREKAIWFERIKLIIGKANAGILDWRFIYLLGEIIHAFDTIELDILVQLLFDKLDIHTHYLAYLVIKIAPTTSFTMRFKLLKFFLDRIHNLPFQCALVDVINYFGKSELEQFIIYVFDNYKLEVQREVIQALRPNSPSLVHQNAYQNAEFNYREIFLNSKIVTTSEINFSQIFSIIEKNSDPRTYKHLLLCWLPYLSPELKITTITTWLVDPRTDSLGVYILDRMLPYLSPHRYHEALAYYVGSEFYSDQLVVLTVKISQLLALMSLQDVIDINSIYLEITKLLSSNDRTRFTMLISLFFERLRDYQSDDGLYLTINHYLEVQQMWN